MSDAERRLWRQLRARVGRLAPEMQTAIEHSFTIVRDSLSISEMARLAEGTRADERNPRDLRSDTAEDGYQRARRDC